MDRTSRAGAGSPPASAMPASRPYRSHLVPACQRCRRRKVRCTIDMPEQPCLLCRLQNAACLPSGEDEPVERSSKRQRRAGPPDTDGSPLGALPPNSQTSDSRTPGSHLRGNVTNEVNMEKSPMIIGPGAAEDVQVIEEFMTSREVNVTGQKPPYHIISSDRLRPILYHSVPTWREGWKTASMRGSSQRDIIEQILGPLAPALMAVYFDRIHPWFPVLDKVGFNHPHGGGKSAAAIYTEIYASSLIYWSTSSTLASHPRPDITYSWNLAVAATQEDFQAPSLTTVCAALLDLNGRPTSSIRGNVLTSAKTVALAHTFGLNRDPSSWNLPLAEKNARIKLWWGVLIHDRWSSFAHGVPPVIIKDQYDVPLPTREPSVDGNGLRYGRGADCFLAMCRLTDILADLLPLVYQLRTRHLIESLHKVSRAQAALDMWQEALPDWITRPDSARDAIHGGSCSLRLSVMAVKMLVCRVALRIVVTLSEPSDPDTVQVYHIELQRSAQSVVDFVCHLDSSNLQEYWSPYVAYHIASAAIVLIRCAIDATDHHIKSTCKNSLKNLITRLQDAKEIDHWDMGDICLAQCCGPVAAIVAAVDFAPARRNHPETTASVVPDLTIGNLESHDFGTLNMFSPSIGSSQDGLQFPWSSLWDMLESSDTTYMH